jgi:transposase
MTIPGIGPIISSAVVAAIGDGAAFARGRNFAAWLGLVPKQISTGDRTIFGRITKRGNRYLRTLFLQAAPRRSASAKELDAARLWTLACRRGSTVAP